MVCFVFVNYSRQEQLTDYFEVMSQFRHFNH